MTKDRGGRRVAKKSKAVETEHVFSFFKVQSLRRRLRKALEVHRDPVEGWSSYDLDFNQVFALVPSLSLKPGIALRAYLFLEGIGGNGVIYALPEDETRDPVGALDATFFRKFIPDIDKVGDFEDPMSAVVGDGSPWSYICASILSRELAEFGAFWHGIDWGTHTIIGKDPLYAKPGTRWRSPPGIRDLSPPGEWEWQKDKPEDWRPRIYCKGRRRRAVFYTHTAYHGERLVRHEDTFKAGTYQLRSREIPLAQGSFCVVF